MVLFECVLAYILPEKADWMIKVLGETFDEVEAVSYDIALVGEASENHSDIQHRHPHDAKNGHGDGDGERQTTTLPPPPPSRFGKIMLSNLEVSCSPQHSSTHLFRHSLPHLLYQSGSPTSRFVYSH